MVMRFNAGFALDASPTFLWGTQGVRHFFRRLLRKRASQGQQRQVIGVAAGAAALMIDDLRLMIGKAVVGSQPSVLGSLRG
jgi:hypothetical protein